jgi:hypothetical protein
MLTFFFIIKKIQKLKNGSDLVISRVIGLTVLMWCVLFVNSFATAAENEISVFIDGEVKSFERKPLILNGSTMVPLRDIFQALGVTVEWHADTRTIYAMNEMTFVSLTIDQEEVTINNEKFVLSQPATIVNNSTYVPLRFVSTAFGGKVSWDGKTKTVHIYKMKELINRGMLIDINTKKVVREIDFTTYKFGQDILDTKELTRLYVTGLENNKMVLSAHMRTVTIKNKHYNVEVVTEGSINKENVATGKLRLSFIEKDTNKYVNTYEGSFKANIDFTNGRTDITVAKAMEQLGLTFDTAVIPSKEKEMYITDLEGKRLNNENPEEYELQFPKDKILVTEWITRDRNSGRIIELHKILDSAYMKGDYKIGVSFVIKGKVDEDGIITGYKEITTLDETGDTIGFHDFDLNMDIKQAMSLTVKHGIDLIIEYLR